MERRVVITGLGAITPIGNNVEELQSGIENKKCGIDKISLFDASGFKTSLCAEVKNYNVLDHFDAKQAKRLDRFSEFAIIAAKEAVADSSINKENIDYNNVGIFVSSGIGGLGTIQKQCEINYIKGHSRVSPMFIPMSISNMAAGNIAIEFGFKGESNCNVTACASSTQSIGEAYRAIKHGYEDVIIAGGAESSICSSGIAGFENMKALSFSNDKNRASIPFDKERSGFVMGEGAGMVVLEELESAKKRGAKIYAEIIGYGSTTDAYHITSPNPTGEDGARAMTRAMNDAKIEPKDIDYINAHGTSTHLNDLIETLAIKKALGEASKDVMVSSTKGNIGHLLGAAGAVEAVICVKALEKSLVPPTINYQVKDEECDLNIVSGEAKKENIKIVMSNSLGFGGHNSSIILKKWEDK